MDVGMDMYDGGMGGTSMASVKKANNTLTPKVLLRIANLPWPKGKTGNWLDDAIVTKEFIQAVTELMNDEFSGGATKASGDCINFFMATCNFLKENNFLPEVELPADTDVLDSIDQMDDRNW